MGIAKKYKTITLAIVVLFTSCTPQKRLTRLITKHPHLLKTDTIYKEKTLVTSPIHADTLYIFSKEVDTFYLDKEKIKLRIIHKTDTLKVALEKQPDTIKINIPEYRIKYITPENKKDNKTKNLTLIVLIIAGTIIIIRLLK